ncbi:MAG: molybdenum cofactor biosynthesis protein MoaE [Alphaproteobacteria bacterium]|nr:molybdenum cofactor biosynthesis protein MoaE [Alphaproteobacteria bacterium]
MSVRVQEQDFDLAAELAGFGDGAGAIVTFTGIVRNNPAGDLREMLIEHYPAMTKPALEQIETDALNRWQLTDSRIIHRFGALKPGAQIMMVATASTHRQNAFEAAEFLMDYLKSRAPFWKKEITTSGEVWVQGKDADVAALKRW